MRMAAGRRREWALQGAAASLALATVCCTLMFLARGRTTLLGRTQLIPDYTYKRGGYAGDDSSSTQKTPAGDYYGEYHGGAGGVHTGTYGAVHRGSMDTPWNARSFSARQQQLGYLYHTLVPGEDAPGADGSRGTEHLPHSLLKKLQVAENSAGVGAEGAGPGGSDLVWGEGARARPMALNQLARGGRERALPSRADQPVWEHISDLEGRYYEDLVDNPGETWEEFLAKEGDGDRDLPPPTTAVRTRQLSLGLTQLRQDEDSLQQVFYLPDLEQETDGLDLMQDFAPRSVPQIASERSTISLTPRAAAASQAQNVESYGIKSLRNPLEA